MPVPNTIHIPAHAVRSSDDLLVDVEAKENAEHGEPCLIDYVDRGDKWCYINLVDTIGRKRVFKFLLSERVWVIRLEPTYEEKRSDLNQKLAARALNDQRRLWDLQNDLAEKLTNGGQFKRAGYGYRRREMEFRPYDLGREVRSAADDITKAEYVRSVWDGVENLWSEGPAEDIAQAVMMMRDRLEERILRGDTFSDGELKMDAYRKWISDVPNGYSYRAALEDLGVTIPEEA